MEVILGGKISKKFCSRRILDLTEDEVFVVGQMSISFHFLKESVRSRPRGAKSIHVNKKVRKMRTFHTKIKGSFHVEGRKTRSFDYKICYANFSAQDDRARRYISNKDEDFSKYNYKIRRKSKKIFFLFLSRFSGRSVLNRLEGKEEGISRGER